VEGMGVQGHTVREGLHASTAMPSPHTPPHTLEANVATLKGTVGSCGQWAARGRVRAM